YFSDTSRHIIVRVDADGKSMRVLAGTEIAGFNGDGKPGRETHLHIPAQIAVHPKNGNIYVADVNNYRIREIAKDGSTVITNAGQGVKGFPDQRLPTEAPIGPGLAFGLFSGDGGVSTEAELNLPAGVDLDKDGNVYIADSGNHRFRLVNTQREA